MTDFQGMDYLAARFHMIMESPHGWDFLVSLCIERKSFNTWSVLTVPSIYLILKSLPIPVSLENLTWKSSQIIASSLCFPLLQQVEECLLSRANCISQPVYLCLLSPAISAYSAARSVPVSRLRSTCQPVDQHLSSS